MSSSAACLGVRPATPAKDVLMFKRYSGRSLVYSVKYKMPKVKFSLHVSIKYSYMGRDDIVDEEFNLL